MFTKYRNSYFSYFVMYMFYFLSQALASALISVYLMGMGFNGTQVSLVVSASFLASMVTQPFIGVLFDRYDLKKVSLCMFVLAIGGAFAFIFCKTLIPVVTIYSFLMILINGTYPVMEKIATASPYAYGKIRIWGTIGYALGTQLAGVLYDSIAPQAIYAAFIVTMILSIIGFAGTQPALTKDETNTEKTSAKDVINTKFIWYLVITALLAGVTGAGNTYIPTMFTNDGFTASTVSTILSFAVLCEAPVIFFSDHFMDTLANKKLLLIGFTAILVQYAVYAFNLPAAFKMAVTLLVKHPMGMLLVMTNLKIVNTIVSERYQITALAIVKTVQNFAAILFNNICGRMIDTGGYTGMFRMLFAVMVIAYVLVLFFRVDSGNDRQLFH